MNTSLDGTGKVDEIRLEAFGRAKVEMKFANAIPAIPNGTPIYIVILKRKEESKIVKKYEMKKRLGIK